MTPPLHLLAVPSERLSLGYIVAYWRWVLGLYGEANPARGPSLLRLWHRIGRLNARFDRLIVQFRAGTLPPPRQSPGHNWPRPSPDAPRILPPPEQRLPHRFGWLQRAIGWRCSCVGLWLSQRFDDPEMQALMAAAPAQCRRVLRPLCHMVHVKPPPVLALPPRPRRPLLAPDTAPDTAPDVAADPLSGVVGPEAAPSRRRARPARPVSPSGRYVRIDGRRIPREWLPGSPLRPPIKPT